MRPSLVSALAAWAIGLGAGHTADVGARIREGRAAAESFQGPLDGRWVLRDAAGQTMFFLELSDPTGGGRLGGAWRSRSGDPAPLEAERRGKRLEIRFAALSLHLHRRDQNRWSGFLEHKGCSQWVVLRR
ncbi:MAG: hypothetical protein ACYC8V_16300 [Caulobacteraceae bacterium]